VATTKDNKGNHVGIITDDQGNQIGVGTDALGNPIPVAVEIGPDGVPRAVALGPSVQIQEMQATQAQAQAMSQAQQVSKKLEEIGINTGPVQMGQMGQMGGVGQNAVIDDMFAEEYAGDGERAVPGQLVRTNSGKVLIKSASGNLLPATQEQI